MDNGGHPLRGPDPFDQDLNTYDNVAFNSVNTASFVSNGFINGAGAQGDMLVGNGTSMAPLASGTSGMALRIINDGYPEWAVPEGDQVNSFATNNQKVVGPGVSGINTLMPADGGSNFTGSPYLRTNMLREGTKMTFIARGYYDPLPSPGLRFIVRLGTVDICTHETPATTGPPGVLIFGWTLTVNVVVTGVSEELGIAAGKTSCELNWFNGPTFSITEWTDLPLGSLFNRWDLLANFYNTGERYSNDFSQAVVNY